MSTKKITNLNKYTLLEEGDIDRIHFYIENAMLDKEITKKTDDLHITFEIKKTKQDKLYEVYLYLINKDKETVYQSYSMYFKQIERYYYAILNGENDISHAEVMPKNTINFKELDFPSFKKLLETEEEFNKMLPELMNALKKTTTEIKAEKEVAETIDIPSPTNYFHNVVGANIVAFEKLIANKEEIDITNKLLKQAKKKFEVVLNSNYDKNLALLNLMAYFYNICKSKTLAADNILKDSDLKTDTNKEELSLKELHNTLEDFMEGLKTEKDNIISERIEYILTTKPRIKEMKNFLKIIVADNKYIDTKRRVRAVSEESLKELLLESLIEETYLPLPRNEVLLYHLKDSKQTDFIGVISLDLIYNLLKTIKINSVDENKNSIKLLNAIDNLYNNIEITQEDEIKILIEQIIMMNIYYEKNVNSKTLLFNKGEYIIDLGYYKGDYDIKIINKNTKKIFGKLIKVTEETTKIIKEALDKSESTFISTINRIIFQNIHESLKNQKLEIEIKNITHKDIRFILKRPRKEDIFECNFPIEGILSLLVSPNKPKQTSVSIKEVKEEDTNYKYNIPIKDYEYIVRKADTISKIMESTPINNKEYIEITKYYHKLQEVKDEKKTEILLKLAELFKIEITDIKKYDIIQKEQN